MNVKRDFGSFHASNVQELLSISEDDYMAPIVPFQTPEFDSKDFVFGLETKKQHFFLEEGCTFLNHGAFGCTLREALICTQMWQNYIERQPLRFFDRELLPLLVAVTRRLAKFVGCSGKDLILMPNVTTAINCIIGSQEIQTQDTVYHLSTEYGAVKKILRHACEANGATLQEAKLNFPLTAKSQVLKLVENSLKPGTKLAVFDHIPSNTPFIMPVAEICEICHAKGVPVLIDGAHALGQLDLDLSAMGDVDYYVSNAHKWLCAPKGCAYMYVHEKHQSSIKPLVVSHGADSGFNSQFIWSGLQDYSPWLALQTVLDFWEAVGPERIRTYIRNTAHRAGEMLTERWSSHLLVNKELSGSMLCVALPKNMYENIENIDYGKAEIIQNALYSQFSIEVPIKAIQGALYVRISAHIHNHPAEYEKLADAILQLSRHSILTQ